MFKYACQSCLCINYVRTSCIDLINFQKIKTVRVLNWIQLASEVVISVFLADFWKDDEIRVGQLKSEYFKGAVSSTLIVENVGAKLRGKAGNLLHLQIHISLAKLYKILTI